MIDNLYYIVLFWVCIIGLCLGSFFNVVILRSLSNESIVFPASKCPKCQHKLYPWHNIPVLSYLFLRGKCYFCKEKISIQYPIIELTTMFLFAGCYIKFGFSIDTIFTIILLSGLLIMTITDLKERVVDCNLAIGLGVMGLIYNYIKTGSIVNSLLGLLIGVIILEAIARIGYLVSKERAMGEADTYVAGALGAYFGIGGVLILLTYSLIASMIFIIPKFAIDLYKNNKKTTCILLILFILSALCFKTLFQNYITLSILLILGISLSVSIIKGIKDKDSNLTYLPFVPAFSAAVLYFIFLI